MTITGAASATVTRDLANLVAKGVLIKKGEKKIPGITSTFRQFRLNLLMFVISYNEHNIVEIYRIVPATCGVSEVGRLHLVNIDYSLIRPLSSSKRPI